MGGNKRGGKNVIFSATLKAGEGRGEEEEVEDEEEEEEAKEQGKIKKKSKRKKKENIKKIQNNNKEELEGVTSESRTWREFPSPIKKRRKRKKTFQQYLTGKYV